MNKHTPAPWYFSDNTRHWKTNPYSITVRKPGVHGTTIANIPNRRSVTDDEKRANALLIAHAPRIAGLRYLHAPVVQQPPGWAQHQPHTESAPRNPTSNDCFQQNHR
jgi:hypothetical protein